MNEFANYISKMKMNWTVIIDILVIIAVATMILIFFKKRNSIKQAVLYMVFFLVYTAVCVVNAMSESSMLYITKKILDVMLLFMLVSVVVIYQTDLKQIAAKLGRTREKNKEDDYTEEDLRIAANEIVKACQTLSKNNTGALIVIAPNIVPRHILDSGTELDALVSSRLLESLFNTKAPLHDGAVVIKGNRTLSAGCFLSLTQDITVSKELGTRHRAAIGITEESDVLAIVVSEETGVISVACKGKIKRYMTPDKLYEQLEITYGINHASKRRG